MWLKRFETKFYQCNWALMPHPGEKTGMITGMISAYGKHGCSNTNRITKACPCRPNASVSPFSLTFWSIPLKYSLFYCPVCGARFKDCAPVALLGHRSWLWPSVCLQQTLRFGSPGFIMTSKFPGWPAIRVHLIIPADLPPPVLPR